MSDLSITTMESICPPVNHAELRSRLSGDCGELVPVNKSKRFWRKALHFCACAVPVISGVALLIGVNVLMVGTDHARLAIGVFGAIIQLILLAATVGAITAMSDAADRRFPELTESEWVIPSRVERFLNDHLGYMDDLRNRAYAFNEQLAAMNGAASLLSGEDSAAYADSIVSMTERHDALQREIGAWNNKVEVELQPYREQKKAQDVFLGDCARLRRALASFDGQAGFPAPTVDVTTLSLAIRTRDSLVERAEKLGLPASVVPSVTTLSIAAAH